MPLQVDPAKKLDEALLDLRLPLTKGYVRLTRELVCEGHQILISPEVLAHFALNICPNALPWLQLGTLILSLLWYRTSSRLHGFANRTLAHFPIRQRNIYCPMIDHLLDSLV